MNTIKQLSEQWLSLQPLTPENQKRLDAKFRLEFNYNSNHLEGNTLTYGETKLLLIFDQTKGNHELREYEEMQAHDVAFKMIWEEAADKERHLTENFIRQLNKIILVRPFWKDAKTADGQLVRRQIKVGEYKEYSNSVELPNGEIFEYASPQETPAMMADLLQWYNDEVEQNRLSPVELAALLHYRYIRIHPFDDGNGRIARLLVNYVLFRNNLLPVIIKTADKKNYLRALQRADAGFIGDFTAYMEEQLLWSLDIAIRAARSESIEEPSDLDKKLSILKQELGESPNDSIRQIHDTKTVKQVLEHSLFPLMSAWEERLKSFDTLFIDRNVKALFYCPLHNEGKTAKNFNRLIEKIKQESAVFNQTELCAKITIAASPQGFRKINNNISINGGTVTVQFYTNAYEITYQDNAKPVNKLYHQSLDEKEINDIVLALGNRLFDIMENIKKQF